jgi:hypothetical protein
MLPVGLFVCVLMAPERMDWFSAVSVFKIFEARWIWAFQLQKYGVFIWAPENEIDITIFNGSSDFD